VRGEECRERHRGVSRPAAGTGGSRRRRQRAAPGTSRCLSTKTRQSARRAPAALTAAHAGVEGGRTGRRREVLVVAGREGARRALRVAPEGEEQQACLKKARADRNRSAAAPRRAAHPAQDGEEAERDRRLRRVVAELERDRRLAPLVGQHAEGHEPQEQQRACNTLHSQAPEAELALGTDPTPPGRRRPPSCASAPS